MNPRIAEIVRPHLDRAAELEAERQEKARRNREQMPHTANNVAYLRQLFGDGIKVKWAIENGHHVGRVPEEFA